jgi:hypothetical protein
MARALSLIVDGWLWRVQRAGTAWEMTVFHLSRKLFCETDVSTSLRAGSSPSANSPVCASSSPPSRPQVRSCVDSHFTVHSDNLPHAHAHTSMYCVANKRNLTSDPTHRRMHVPVALAPTNVLDKHPSPCPGLTLSAPGVPTINVPLIGRGQGSVLVTVRACHSCADAV